MYIIFTQRGERQQFTDFCSRILWALKPTFIKELMTKGSGFVRQNYPYYREDAKLYSNLDALRHGKRHGEWLLNDEVVNDCTIKQIMDDQIHSLQDLVSDDYETFEFFSPIKVYSCDFDELCLEVEMSKIPLSWLSVLAKSFNLMIKTICIDYRKKNPYKTIEWSRISPMPGDQVRVLVWTEKRCGRLVTIQESRKSDVYSFEIDRFEYIFCPNPFFEMPDEVYPLQVELSNLVDGNDAPTSLGVYNPMLEFIGSGGRSEAPEVDDLIGQQFYRSLFDIFSNVTEDLEQGPERDYLKEEVKLFEKRGWNEYIVYLAELIPQISQICISLKGSAMESLLLKKVTGGAEGSQEQHLFEHGIVEDLFNCPLFLECNIVGPRYKLAEKKNIVAEAILGIADMLWLNAYSIDYGNAFIISKQRIASNTAQAFGDDWRDYDSSCKYLRININANNAI